MFRVLLVEACWWCPPLQGQCHHHYSGPQVCYGVVGGPFPTTKARLLRQGESLQKTGPDWGGTRSAHSKSSTSTTSGGDPNRLDPSSLGSRSLKAIAGVSSQPTTSSTRFFVRTYVERSRWSPIAGACWCVTLSF